MFRRFLFATAMIFVTALAFTGPATSEPDPKTDFYSSQL